MTLNSHALRIVESSKVVQLHQQLQSSRCSEDEFVAVVFGHSIFIRSLLVMHRKTATYRAHIGFNPLWHKSALLLLQSVLEKRRAAKSAGVSCT